MQTNFFGYLYCTKHALPHLKKNKGQIIVISSMSGEIGLPWRTAYCSSKFAVTGFFEALRSEIYETGLGITIVCPPTVRTIIKNQFIISLLYLRLIPP
jgi:short-subunit dehydrogenase